MNDNVFDPHDKDEPDYEERCNDCDGELPHCYCDQVDSDHDISMEEE